MSHHAFVRWAGLSLAAAGALVILLNVTLTPLMARDVPFEITAVTSVFLWRQAVSAVAMALLLFGAVGLYLAQADRVGRLGALAFVMAFLGSALVLAWEWVNVFVLRDLALQAPSALQTLEGAKGLGLYDLGAIIPITVFTVGWILFAASTLRGSPPLRRASGLVIAGFFAIPALSASLGQPWGAMLGNAVLGLGWFLLGLQLRIRRDA